MNWLEFIAGELFAVALFVAWHLIDIRAELRRMNEREDRRDD